MEFTVAEKSVFAEWASHLCKRLEKSEKELTKEGNRISRPKIQDIPRYMAEKVEFQRYYKPQIISLNKLHARTPQGELYKEAWAAMYLKDTNLKLKDLYMEICYENASYPMDIKPMWRNLHSEVFRRHLNADSLIMDGCCVLQLLQKSNNSVDPEQGLKISIDKIVRVHQDLLIMDNQIPFQLLRLLCHDEAMLEQCLHNFLQVHGILIESSAPKLPRKKKENQEVKVAVDEEEEEDDEEDPVHLLDYLRRALLMKVQHKFYKDINNKKMNRECLHLRKYRIGTIRELKAAGIHVIKYSHSHRNFLFPDFHKVTLQLPELNVDGTTAHIFLNLVAYEMCPDFRNSFEISSFLVFMSSLIDQQEDVKAWLFIYQESGEKYAHLMKFEGASENLKLFKADLLSYESIYSAIVGCSAVFHVACPTVAKEQALDFAERTGIDLVRICPTVMLGPILQSTSVNATSLFLLNLLKGCEPVENKLRWIIEVRDLADALLLAYEKIEAQGRYICTSCPAKPRDLVHKLKSLYPNYNYLTEFIEVYYYIRLSSEKLQRLGWRFLRVSYKERPTSEKTFIRSWALPPHELVFLVWLSQDLIARNNDVFVESRQLERVFYRGF
ncbi:hypothetical protein PIB30_096554 [Stylosanthes scabra]|uniref:Uncharacterized protein n=1 Tax=Stylosanthes scabra TaxID=79078 RepID=A0ABU6VWC4_9FABA|nr:hypothetical protein [Stylosanthes scabra]